MNDGESPHATGCPLINNVSVRASSPDLADLEPRGELAMAIFVGMFLTICQPTHMKDYVARFDFSSRSYFRYSHTVCYPSVLYQCLATRVNPHVSLSLLKSSGTITFDT